MTKVINQHSGKNWNMYHGDSIEVIQGIPDASIGMSIFSPPFGQLFAYSNSERDMGNSRSDDQFFEHFGFLVKELKRVTMPGRMVAFHCANIPAMKERDGYIGLKHLRGHLIEWFIREGFIFHSEHVIWKDPLIEATRTKAIGLMHKQLVKDSTRCRAGIPDYLIAMRAPGQNKIPVPHENGLEYFVGEDPPTGGVMAHEIWRRYASPVWMDINQTGTLNKTSARDPKDTRHICPLQLDVIERALILWSNPNEIVLSPFAGIGSEGYVTIKKGRKFIGIELKDTYYKQAHLNIARAEHDASFVDLI